jgi:hypothetical protein
VASEQGSNRGFGVLANFHADGHDGSSIACGSLPREGVEPRVSGNRFYPWRLNRDRFNPFVMYGLPYCVAERPQGLSLPSAIRKVAAEAMIDIGNDDLPEIPPRLSLL